MKISVITPTWQRHRLLLERCIPSVANQSVAVTHIVVSDGPDPELQDLLKNVNVLYYEVDEHHDHPTNVGGWARNEGLEQAVGADLIAYLDDDNAYRTDHIKVLSESLLATPQADFVYSQMQRHGLNDVIGSEPPTYGTIDSSIIMHRRDTHLKYGWWPTPSGYAIDWELIQAWLSQGATWQFVPEVTVDYYYKGS